MVWSSVLCGLFCSGVCGNWKGTDLRRPRFFVYFPSVVGNALICWLCIKVAFLPPGSRGDEAFVSHYCHQLPELAGEDVLRDERVHTLHDINHLGHAKTHLAGANRASHSTLSWPEDGLDVHKWELSRVRSTHIDALTSCFSTSRSRLADKGGKYSCQLLPFTGTGKCG